MGDMQISSPSSSASERIRSSMSPSCSRPDPSSISENTWMRAEKATNLIMNRTQPTVFSEYRRQAVIEYVQRIIQGVCPSEVISFGSVPLKTYLPDGDIDLTVFTANHFEDYLADAVRNALEDEEKNNFSEFKVKEVQYIRAEVKLVKCLIQNIVVDISFNQLGGLCTLCFLEEVLYKFLDYFSKFEWDNYGLSINVEPPEVDD